MFPCSKTRVPLWIYEEEDLVFNASPGVVRFSEKRHFFSFLIPIAVFLIGAMFFHCSSKIMLFIIMKK